MALARYAAEQTHDLSFEAARQADRMLACDPDRLTRLLIRRLVDEVRLYHDPDRAVEDERHALAARRVELRAGATPATTEVTMDLDTADAHAFDRTLSEVAAALGRLGDHDDLDIRRAPQAALDLLTTGQPSGTGRMRGGGATLFVHLDLATLADLTLHAQVGGGYDERLGVASTDLIHHWLTTWLGTDATIPVKPVLELDDPDALAAVHRHDPTGPMADLVRLRDPVCVFPGCRTPSRACDLDHIVPYTPPDHGGPPGQTHPRNLAPLCRHHHRVKTHGGWTYHRLSDGGYRWTTPTGRTLDLLPARPRPPRR